MSKMHHPLYEYVGGIVGEEYVKDDKLSLITYAKDMSSNPAVLPGMVVRPGSTEEIAEIVKLANRFKCPVTLRGGGESANGVTKGVPKQNIVLDMGRLCKVPLIDVENQRVTFEAGIRPYQLDEALKPYGYFCHTVMGPYHTDSMGGLISGVQGAGYPKDMQSAGLNWHHILGFKVVLPTGEVITTGAGHDSNYMRDSIQYRAASSPDLTGLFMSGGGAFGIITEFSMRIYKLPKERVGFTYLFNSQEEAWDAMYELSAEVPTPYTQLYMSDTNSLKMFGIAVTQPWCSFISVESQFKEDLDLRVAHIKEVSERHGGVMGSPQVNYFAMYGFTGTSQFVRESSSMVCPFLSLESLNPRTEAKELMNKMDQQFLSDPENLRKYHCGRNYYFMPIENFILMGLTFHWDDTVPGSGEYALKRWREIAETLNKAGSCSAYTQGNNSNVIAEMWTPAYRNLMKSLKTMLDPNNILCPGLWNL